MGFWADKPFVPSGDGKLRTELAQPPRRDAVPARRPLYAVSVVLRHTVFRENVLRPHRLRQERSGVGHDPVPFVEPPALDAAPAGR